MPGVELSTSACDGHVVLALHGDLDISGAANAGAAITALVVPDRCMIIDMSALDFIDRGSLDALLRVQWLAWSTGGDVVLAAPQRHVLQLLALAGMDQRVLDPSQRAGRRGGAARSRGTVRRAADRGEHCMLWEGSAIAYWYQVIAVGAAAVRAGSLRAPLATVSRRRNAAIQPV